MKKLALVLFAVLALAAYADDPKPSCSMEKEHHAQAAAAPEGKAVEMTGKLLCRHCNLHQSETCEKVFQPSNDEKTLYSVCSHSKVDVEKVGEEGAAVLRIKGKIVKCAADGKEELFIESATKVAEAK